MSSKYTLYSTDWKEPIDPVTSRIFKDGTSINSFVKSLPTNKFIVLEAAPTSIPTKFDSSDLLQKWIAVLDPGAQLSIAVDDTADGNVQYFRISFQAPWPMVFSSTSSALNYAFEAPTSLANGECKIPAPGLDEKGNVLYAGLDPTQTATLDSNVEQIFNWAGLKSSLKYIPEALRSVKASLDATKASGNHNALWIYPSYGTQTTIRLQFQLQEIQTLFSLVSGSLKGLIFETAQLVCRKVVVAGPISKDTTVAVDNGQAIFYAGCKITSVGPDVRFSASIEFLSQGISLEFTFASTDIVEGILTWLGGLVSVDLEKQIHGVFEQDSDKSFDHDSISLRRIKIVLLQDEKGKLYLFSFSVGVQITANFGNATDNKPVLFLLTYTWTDEGGSLGTLLGQLWTSYDFSDSRDISPYYEKYLDLQPFLKTPSLKPATSINLAALIKGETIKDIPDNIPQELTRAMISISTTRVSIGATIKAKDVKSTAVPQPYLGMISVDAGYQWGGTKSFNLALRFHAGLKPSPTSKSQESAVLLGSLVYASGKWTADAALKGLHASALYELFDKHESSAVMTLIDSIVIEKLLVHYDYDGKVGSHLTVTGGLIVGGLRLQLTYDYQKSWTFIADLRIKDEKSTLGEVLRSIFGSAALDIPEFLSDIDFSQSDYLSLNVSMKKSEKDSEKDKEYFQFVLDVTIKGMSLTFVQYRGTTEAWKAAKVPKRMLKITLHLDALPPINVPLVGDLQQPFDEVYFVYVQDETQLTKEPGLTRSEVININKSLESKEQLVPKDKFAKQDDGDVLFSVGSHFVVIVKSSSGRDCLLDYAFKASPKKVENKINDKQLVSGASLLPGQEQTADAPVAPPALAPFKKKIGPVSISNIGVDYDIKTKQLKIKLDASFALGPLAFALLDFTLGIEITKLNEPLQWKLHPDLQGLAATFNKSPLSISGIIKHGATGDLDYYAGGLIIGFKPWQFQAAGFYGKATPKKGDPFTSVFVFAKLNGPLVTFEFGEISGVTGGFGYKSQVRIPTVEQIVQFPFIKPDALPADLANAMIALEELIDPGPAGWFSPSAENNWAAAGMKISAFQMLSVDAVLVIQFGTSIQAGIFAVAVGDIPNQAAPLKFAHVELGIAIVLDFDYGILKAEGQLSPNSYILHPDCHLTGGFGLYYWFDAPHADKNLVGNFVFTLGGYHPSFVPPVGYPVPPRLGISWNLGPISIGGEAYFAITPKVCMGGGRLHASFKAGPIEACFDAFANFLINYKPFHFTAGAGICVAVRFNLDILFIHTHISVELGAELYLWGPPLAGRAHVDFWITSFDIYFGNTAGDVPDVHLIDFYHLVVKSATQKQSVVSTSSTGRVTDVTDDQKPDPPKKNEAHNFLALSGLVNNSESPTKQPNAPWIVRGGTFCCVISCTLAINKVTRQVGEPIEYNDIGIFSRPMKLTKAMSSELELHFTQDGVPNEEDEWIMEKVLKPAPIGLWAQYTADTDPTNRNVDNSKLLDTTTPGSVPLMMGVQIKPPLSKISDDPFPVFDIKDSQVTRLVAEKSFPGCPPSSDAFVPVDRLGGEAAWDAVLGSWQKPSWGGGDDGRQGFVGKWAEKFGWDVTSLKKLSIIPPKLEKQFKNLYVSAPLLTG